MRSALQGMLFRAGKGFFRQGFAKENDIRFNDAAAFFAPGCFLAPCMRGDGLKAVLHTALQAMMMQRRTVQFIDSM